MINWEELTTLTRTGGSLLQEIAQNVGSGGGGSDLPDVTAADNGNVLTVVNGAWDKAEPRSCALIVHMDESMQLLDKTWQEIDNVKPLAYLELMGAYLPLRSCGSEDGTYYVSFQNYWSESSPELYCETNAADGYPQHTDE